MWDGGRWGSPAWQRVDCEITEATSRWGATDEAGILSVASAGEMDIRTLDPKRILDPTNNASPFYGAIRPGTPVRILGLVPGEVVAGTGILDEAGYDVGAERGRLRAIDGIAYLGQAQVPDGAVLPNTLRARIRAVVAAVGLGSLVPVEAEPGSNVERIINGGFENGLTGWTAFGATTVFADPSSSPAGGMALRTVGNGAAYPVTQQRLSVIPGATYTVRAYSKSAGTSVEIDTRVDSTLGATTITGGVVSFVRTAAAETDYKLDTATYVVPADGSVDGLFVQLYIGSGASLASQDCRWDGVSVVGPAEPQLVDPPVAVHDGKAASAWDIINRAAQDALTYVWLDPAGVLRSRSWGALPDAGFNLGCPDPESADEPWLSGITTIVASASGAPVRNSIRAYTAGTTWSAARTDPVSAAKYGPRPFDAARVVPSFATWADRILADRADAGLAITAGEVRPFTLPELAYLLGLDGPEVVRVRDDEHGPVIDYDAGVIGATLGVTAHGWRWRLVTTIPRVEWDAVEPPPVVPPIPPPNPYHTESRTYIATSDALLALTSGGARYGAGGASTIPVGGWSGWTYRGVIAFPAIPWTKVRAVVSATLNLDTTTQVRVGFGSSPKLEVRRITQSWSAGSSSSPSSGNAVVWPGPSTTDTGKVVASMPTAQNAAKGIRVDAIARSWAPTSVGGTAAPQYGLMLRETSSSGTYTTEVWPVEKGGAQRPELVLVLEVFD